MPWQDASPADTFRYSLQDGYRLQRVLGDLTFPTSVTFDDWGRVYVVDGGFAYGPTYTPARILRLPAEWLASRGASDAAADAEVLCGDGLIGPVTGVAFHDDRLYVAHRGRISIVRSDGTLHDIVSGLPSLGDYQNNKLAFGPDGWLYFGQGTATNSGVVGLDNHRYGWLRRNPGFCDIPAHDVTLMGQNFTTPNPLDEGGAAVTTGAYSPFGVPTVPVRSCGAACRARGRCCAASPMGLGWSLWHGGCAIRLASVSTPPV